MPKANQGTNHIAGADPAGFPSMSLQNHEMLVKLNENLGSLGNQVSQFIAAQSEENRLQRDENRRIHERIDASDERTAKAVEGIKDGMASRGKITGAAVFSTISAVVMVCMAMGGITHGYIGVRLENLSPRIEALAEQDRAQRERAQINADRISQLERDLSFTRGKYEAESSATVKMLDRLYELSKPKP